MKFVARLLQNGFVSPGTFTAQSFESAMQDAKRAFPDHEIITIYPENHALRVAWLDWKVNQS